MWLVIMTYSLPTEDSQIIITMQIEEDWGEDEPPYMEFPIGEHKVEVDQAEAWS